MTAPPCCHIPPNASHRATVSAIAKAMRCRIHMAGTAFDQRMLAIAMRRWTRVAPAPDSRPKEVNR